MAAVSFRACTSWTRCLVPCDRTLGAEPVGTDTAPLAGSGRLPGPVNISHAVLQISTNSTTSRCALHPYSLPARTRVAAQPGSSMGPASPAPQTPPGSPKISPR